jgi:hypothetical protein
VHRFDLEAGHCSSFPKKKNLSCIIELYIYFLKREQKICPNLLIKKKRGVQLIKEKLGENRYKETTNEQRPTQATT